MIHRKLHRHYSLAPSVRQWVDHEHDVVDEITHIHDRAWSGYSWSMPVKEMGYEEKLTEKSTKREKRKGNNVASVQVTLRSLEIANTDMSRRNFLTVEIWPGHVRQVKTELRERIEAGDKTRWLLMDSEAYHGFPLSADPGKVDLSEVTTTRLLNELAKRAREHGDG